jgi:hypothetical protein
MRKTIKAIIVSAAVFLVQAGIALAVTPTVNISQLPEYLKTDNFKLSYTALSDDPCLDYC